MSPCPRHDAKTFSDMSLRLDLGEVLFFMLKTAHVFRHTKFSWGYVLEQKVLRPPS